MASVISAHKKLKKKNIPKLEAHVYAETSLSTLILVSIYFLRKHGIPALAEEITAAGFRLFPQSFALKNYPRWPDSALALRRIADCREKGYLKGNAADGFELKFKAQKLAERTALALGVIKPAKAKIKRKPKVQPVQSKKPLPQKNIEKAAKEKAVHKPIAKSSAPKKASARMAIAAKPISVKKAKARLTLQPEAATKPKLPKARRKIQKPEPAQMALPLPVKRAAPEPKNEIAPPAVIVKQKKNAPLASKAERAKAEKIVRVVERSDAYRHFRQHGARTKLNEFDFRNMLLATMESTPETLTRNLKLFKDSAALQQHQELIAFLDFCEAQFANLLKPAPKRPVKRKA
ncbi:MAG: hypothetical protein IT311_08455 [Anaerolineales bacterium]|nr:hypothetical protein [Anaerolineales bacterium]MCZ2122949.1 hypothetical protein [Anaerolineales bacterium]